MQNIGRPRGLVPGRKGGLGEITLPELQAGSSIMPGKVNPVLSEAVSQLYYLVSGNNLAIEHCAVGAQLELGVMLPLMIDRLVESFKIDRGTSAAVCQKVRGRHKS